MNIQPKAGSIVPETVTTGPLTGSKKVYYTVPGHPDVQVPYREISVSDPKEPPVRVYDASGPYTETDIGIDLSKGLKRIRAPWLARRANLATYAGRAVKPEDNGGVRAKSSCRPARPSPPRSPAARGPSRNMNSPAPASSPKR